MESICFYCCFGLAGLHSAVEKTMDFEDSVLQYQNPQLYVQQLFAIDSTPVVLIDAIVQRHLPIDANSAYTSIREG